MLLCNVLAGHAYDTTIFSHGFLNGSRRFAAQRGAIDVNVAMRRYISVCVHTYSRIALASGAIERGGLQQHERCTAYKQSMRQRRTCGRGHQFSEVIVRWSRSWKDSRFSFVALSMTFPGSASVSTLRLFYLANSIVMCGGTLYRCCNMTFFSL